MDFGFLNQALGAAGSEYQVPLTQNPSHVASTRDPWGEPYAGNPAEYSDAHSRAREAAPAPAATPAPAVSTPTETDPNVNAANQILAGDSQGQQPTAADQNQYAQEPVERTGAQKQANLKNKGMNLVSAVANFYGGNWVGAANSAKNFFNDGGEDKPQGATPGIVAEGGGQGGGMLGGLMGGGGQGQGQDAMGMLSKIFGG